jgi:hypothetical protein
MTTALFLQGDNLGLLCSCIMRPLSQLFYSICLTGSASYSVLNKYVDSMQNLSTNSISIFANILMLLLQFLNFGIFTTVATLRCTSNNSEYDKITRAINVAVFLIISIGFYIVGQIMYLILRKVTTYHAKLMKSRIIFR